MVNIQMTKSKNIDDLLFPKHNYFKDYVTAYYYIITGLLLQLFGIILFCWSIMNLFYYFV